MCVSRLHRVVTAPDSGWIEVDDADGVRRRVSLLAYEGPPPAPGQWVVVHSGYALGPVDPAEADAVMAELRSNTDPEPARPVSRAIPGATT
jgi:hydrogenase maturation factor